MCSEFLQRKAHAARHVERHTAAGIENDWHMRGFEGSQKPSAGKESAQSQLKATMVL